jgi:hypothetical protein
VPIGVSQRANADGPAINEGGGTHSSTAKPNCRLGRRSGSGTAAPIRASQRAIADGPALTRAWNAFVYRQAAGAGLGRRAGLGKAVPIGVSQRAIADGPAINQGVERIRLPPSQAPAGPQGRIGHGGADRRLPRRATADGPALNAGPCDIRIRNCRTEGRRRPAGGPQGRIGQGGANRHVSTGEPIAAGPSLWRRWTDSSTAKPQVPAGPEDAGSGPAVPIGVGQRANADGHSAWDGWAGVNAFVYRQAAGAGWPAGPSIGKRSVPIGVSPRRERRFGHSGYPGCGTDSFTAKPGGAGPGYGEVGRSANRYGCPYPGALPSVPLSPDRPNARTSRC